MRAGDYVRARNLLLPLAERGDSQAMITIGLMYHQGHGVTQDYALAMDWHLKAFEKNDGDAFNNIGVMYRDGLGVPQNRKVAYFLFLITHLTGLGSSSTQYRAGANIDKEMAEQSSADRQEALCYTATYIKRYVLARGKLLDIPSDVRPSNGDVRLKDANLWLPDEKKQMKFSCPPPWN
jgi:TPR repeat protein